MWPPPAPGSNWILLFGAFWMGRCGLLVIQVRITSRSTWPRNGCRCPRPFSNKGPGHHHPFLGHVGLEVILTWMTNSPHLTIQNAPKSRVQLLPGAGGGHNLCVSASAALEANFSKLSIWQSNWLKIKILLCKWVSGSSKIASDLKSSKKWKKSISKIIFVFYYLRG